GSSSPSANSRIIGFTPHRKGALPVDEFHLEDGASFFCSPTLATKYNLAVDSVLSAGQAQLLAAESWYGAARHKALALLARREHSRFELVRKLCLLGCPETHATEVVDTLAAEGLQDDRRFTAAWIESRMRKHPESLSQMELRLSEHRIRREIIGDFVSYFCDSRDIDDMELHLCRLARRKLERAGLRRSEERRVGK